MEFLWCMLFMIMLGIYAWQEYFRKEKSQRIKDQVKRFRLLASSLHLDKNLAIYETAFDRVLAGALNGQPRADIHEKYGMVSDEAYVFLFLLGETNNDRNSRDFSLSKELLETARFQKIIDEKIYNSEMAKIAAYEKNIS